MHTPATRRTLFATVVALTLCLWWGQGASANMAKWWHEGEGYGPLVPQSDTDVRVDSEYLSFEIAPSLDHADVTATYQMTNGGAAASSAEVAFVLVVHELAESSGDGPHASIVIDDAPVAFRVVTDADVLEPALDAWFDAHPELEPELARLTTPTINPGYQDFAELRRLVPGCRGECNELLRCYKHRKASGTHDAGTDAGLDPKLVDPKLALALRAADIVAAAEVAIPEEITKLRKGWSRSSNTRRLAWLAFHLDFAAGATRKVIVRYRHGAGDDASRGVNQTFTYDYLLSPARRWARFGQLHVAIQVPPDAQLKAALPLTRDGNTYRADLPGIPDGELSFEVMSRKGLIFGMTQSTGYWLLLIAVMTGLTFFLSTRLARVWAAGSRLRLWVGCICGTGLLLGIANSVVAGLGVAAFPERALGIGYGSAFGLIALLFLFSVAGMAVSAVTASRRRARARETLSGDRR